MMSEINAVTIEESTISGARDVTGVIAKAYANIQLDAIFDADTLTKYNAVTGIDTVNRTDAITEIDVRIILLNCGISCYHFLCSN